jgi:hypothetical protein
MFTHFAILRYARFRGFAFVVNRAVTTSALATPNKIIKTSLAVFPFFKVRHFLRSFVVDMIQ